MEALFKNPFQHTPASYLAEVSMTTSEKQSQAELFYPPRIIELLDIIANTTQKVLDHW